MKLHSAILTREQKLTFLRRNINTYAAKRNIERKIYLFIFI